MFTKYNIGDTVLIKGTIRRIEIGREGKFTMTLTRKGVG